MKEKIFETMENYGWNLENFNEVFETHYNFIESLYDYFREHDENMKSCDLNDIDEQKLHDMVDFMSDFLRAFKDNEKYVRTFENDNYENIIDKVVEIEDYNGNTIMAFEINECGKIVNYNNCNIADIDSDYIFDTNKDLMRIQVERV